MFRRHALFSMDSMRIEVRKFLIMFRLYEKVYDLTSLYVKALSPELLFQKLVTKLNELDEKAKSEADKWVTEWVKEDEPQKWAEDFGAW